ncbi:hypothetical protein NUSPORA_01491 [Nucleospora cyclopteri]
MTSHLYDFKLKDCFGKKIDLNLYKGKAIIIVNVASKCGLAEKSYNKLRKIKETYPSEVVIILCPCKQFLSQEHDKLDKVIEFVDHKLGTNIKEQQNLSQEKQTVILTEVIEVKGSNMHPLYGFLIKEQTGFITNNIKWNFSVFLGDKQGKIVKRYSPLGFITYDDHMLVKVINDK